MGVHEAGGELSFQGATVSIGGRRAPLLAIAAQGLEEQINLQVPFETEGGKTTTVEVDNNGKRTRVEGVPVLAAQPGIFQVPAAEGVNVAAAIHADGRLVTPGAPARRGEIISIFLTGGGALQPTVATGDPGPVPPATIMQPVVVGVANIGCAVYFSGYAPSFVGLYQINFEVPRDAPAGATLNLVVKVGEVFSSPAPLAVA